MEEKGEQHELHDDSGDLVCVERGLAAVGDEDLLFDEEHDEEGQTAGEDQQREPGRDGEADEHDADKKRESRDEGEVPRHSCGDVGLLCLGTRGFDGRAASKA